MHLPSCATQVRKAYLSMLPALRVRRRRDMRLRPLMPACGCGRCHMMPAPTQMSSPCKTWTLSSSLHMHFARPRPRRCSQADRGWTLIWGHAAAGHAGPPPGPREELIYMFGCQLFNDNIVVYIIIYIAAVPLSIPGEPLGMPG